MPDEITGQGEIDLKAIDEYLMSDESPDNCMQLSAVPSLMATRRSLMIFSPTRLNSSRHAS